jgi:Na+/H+-dicarboxylate symporter
MILNQKRFSPVGIWSLICGAVINMDDPKLVFAKISYYAMTVLIGLFIHGCIVLPLIYVITTRKNIFVYTKNMLEAFLVAIATSSRLEI